MNIKVNVTCSECIDWMRSLGDGLAHVIGACAAAGIEHDLSTEEAFQQYLDGFHGRGHVEVSGGA